ncbi:MAG TPA: CPBP family intramembrane metalloprotease [Clostridiales bacterium]|nr:CPBP family intramembrane metalloprotease [Clostridiales bacterium]
MNNNYGYVPFNVPNNQIVSNDVINKQAEIKDIKRLGNKIGGSLILYTVLSNVLSIGLLLFVIVSGAYDQANPNYISGINPTAYYLLSGCISIATAVISGIFLCKLSKNNIDHVIKLKIVNFKKTLALMLVCMSFIFISNIALSLLNLNLSLFGFKNTIPESNSGSSIVDYGLYFLSVAIIPPLVEEFLFRGAIMGSLRKYGDGFAILISSLLFGLAHGNFVQTPVTFLAGLLMGALTIYTGSLIPSIILHFLNNSLSVVTDIAVQTFGEQIPSVMYTGLMVVSLVVGLLAMAYLAKKDKHILTVLPSSTIATLKQKTLYVFTSVTIIIVVIINLITAITVAVGSAL